METTVEGRSNTLRLGILLHKEQQIKLYSIRLAFLEKLVSRIGAVTVVWATAVVVGGFGFLLTELDFRIVSLIAFAQSFRLFIRGHELVLQAIWRDPQTDPQPIQTLTSRRFSRADISIMPFTFASYIFKPQQLRISLGILQLLVALACVALPMWRLSYDFCFDDAACQWSAYIFYGLTIAGAVLYVLEKSLFELLLCSLRNGRIKTKLDSDSVVRGVVFQNFCITVYAMCLKGSIYDGFDMNLVVFAIQWLQSDELQHQLHGAKLLNKLLNDKQDTQTADALRRLQLGTYPGLLERLVEMLYWDSEDDRENELVHEVATIVCDLVALYDNCSRFAAVPGALDAVVSLLRRRADNSNVGERSVEEIHKDEKRRTVCKGCQHVLRALLNNQSTSGKALHQLIEDMDLRDVFGDDKESVLCT